MAGKWMKYLVQAFMTGDGRSKLINEYVSGIRILKYNAWENFAYNKIFNLRKREIALYFKAGIIRTFIVITMFMIPMLMLFIIITLYVYTGHDLTLAKTFTVILLFKFLQVQIMFLTK